MKRAQGNQDLDTPPSHPNTKYEQRVKIYTLYFRAARRKKCCRICSTFERQ